MTGFNTAFHGRDWYTVMQEYDFTCQALRQDRAPAVRVVLDLARLRRTRRRRPDPVSAGHRAALFPATLPRWARASAGNQAYSLTDLRLRRYLGPLLQLRSVPVHRGRGSRAGRGRLRPVRLRRRTEHLRAVLQPRRQRQGLDSDARPRHLGNRLLPCEHQRRASTPHSGCTPSRAWRCTTTSRSRRGCTSRPTCR